MKSGATNRASAKPVSTLAALACALLATLLAAPVHAEADKHELQQRFKDRYPRLLKAQDAGKVGETWKGFVEAVSTRSVDDDIRKMIDNENSDRRALYRLLAKDQDTTEEKVAERARVRKYERAAPDHFVQSRAGDWIRKRDFKEDSDRGGDRDRDRGREGDRRRDGDGDRRERRD